MKRFLLTMFTVSVLCAETVNINNFQTDIFSKVTNSLEKIEVSLVFDVNGTVPTYKIKDGLNIVISSFYLEDLFTSKSKESFKELLKSYLKKKHNIEVNSIYIEDMQKKDQVSIDDLIKKIEDIKKKEK